MTHKSESGFAQNDKMVYSMKNGVLDVVVTIESYSLTMTQRRDMQECIANALNVKYTKLGIATKGGGA